MYVTLFLNPSTHCHNIVRIILCVLCTACGYGDIVIQGATFENMVGYGMYVEFYALLLMRELTVTGCKGRAFQINDVGLTEISNSVMTHNTARVFGSLQNLKFPSNPHR